MRHLLHILFPLLVACLFFAGCGSSPAPTGSNPTAPAQVTLKVFAAASLTESFNEIKKNYQAAHHNITITYNFAGSQVLEQQMANGAADDVFASADQTNMKKASDAGLVGSSQVFARNKLVVIVPTSNPGHVSTLKDLANKGVKIDVAAPAVPVGKYGLQVLDKLGKSPDYGPAYESSVKANFVSQEDNVKAVVQKVELGEADAGIVYRTDVTTSAASKVTVIDIPDALNVIAEYPIAVTKNAPHATDAQAFVQCILSGDGQAVLAKYHFLGTTSS